MVVNDENSKPGSDKFNTLDKQIIEYHLYIYIPQLLIPSLLASNIEIYISFCAGTDQKSLQFIEFFQILKGFQIFKGSEFAVKTSPPNTLEI